MFLIDVVRPHILVELGTHAGDSYCAFCQGVKELNLDTHCYAIDTWRGDPHSGVYDKSVLEELRAHHDPLYGSFSRLIQSTFDDALVHFTDGSIGLLHIDGYHTYEAVKHDFENWLPKMGAEGVILLHDINVRERDFGIGRYWDEIKQLYPHFEFLHGHGLGVLSVGNTRSPELSAILNATKRQAVEIQRFFFQLGHRLSLQQQVDDLHQEISATQKQLATLLDEAQEHPQWNCLQVFWDDGNGFSEDQSIEHRFEADGRVDQHLLRLPINACKRLRLDPCNRSAYVEVHRIELYAMDDQSDGGRELLATWSPADQFAGLIAVSGIAPLPTGTTYRFIAVDDDPQLLLEGAPAHSDNRPRFLLVTLSVSEDFREPLSTEIASLERQIVERRRLLEDKERELATLQDNFDEQTGKIQIYSSQLAEKAEQLQSMSVELTRASSKLEDLARQIAAQDEAIKAKETARQALEMALQEQKTSERALRSDLTNAQSAAKSLHTQYEADREELSREIVGHRQTINSLSSESARLEIKLRETEHQLHEKEYQLQRIKNTLGWRLLSRYGRLKYGLFLPVINGVRNFFEILLQRNYQPALQPIHELRQLEDGAWESTGRDPQFRLSGKWPRGWVEISIEIKPEMTVEGDTRLYVDRGAGYTEQESYDLGSVGAKRTSLVRLSNDVVGLRLDPFESASRFRLEQFFLKPALGGAGNINGAKEEHKALFNLKEFAEFARARATSFRQKNGRSPNLLDLPGAIKRTLRAWNTSRLNGIGSVTAAHAEACHAFPKYQLPSVMEPYDAWLRVNRWNSRREALLRQRLADAPSLPLLSILMPVYNPAPEFLEKAIDSVARQVYQNWELCIADDASTDPAISEILQRWSREEPRVRVVFRSENGHISRATNSAAELATGEYAVLMDQDDELTPDALGEVALYLAQNPETDVVYSDDDKINSQGQRFAPQFKPDWSPELLLSYMYFSHLFVLRRSLFMEIGGLRAGYEGSQDYDLALRVTETTDRIGHIPKVLYHWRVLPGSTAESGGAKPDSFRIASDAIKEAFTRRGVEATVSQPDWAVRASCGIFTHIFPDEGPQVSIIIPTRNNVALLKACIDSIHKTSYKNYEVVIVDNESDDPDTLGYLSHTRHRVLRIRSTENGFSFAAINNRAVEQVKSDYVLFLNNDTEVITPEWLSQMVGYLGLSGVGAVGARLRYPDGRLQHAGVVHGYYGGMAGPAFKLLPASNHGYLSYTMVARNYSAVTAACLLTRRDLFLQLGGFDEENFSVAYNDVDYCYRLRDAGYRVAYCPTAELIHHEGLSRGFADNPSEPAAFREKYRSFRDPYYNPNLSLLHEGFGLDARTTTPQEIRPIRALMCAFNLNREGAPHSQFELTVELKQRGVIDPIVYCSQDGPLRDAYEERGIKVKVFKHPLADVHDGAAYEAAIQNFAKNIQEWDIELVYANTRQTFFAIDAAKRLGVPSIWNPRESEPWQTYFDYLAPDIALHALECFRYPYKVVFVSNATRESCAPLNTNHNFMTIHNGLDLKAFTKNIESWSRQKARSTLKLESDETAVLLLGTVCERKGQLDIVAAIEQLDEESTCKLRCFIVGDRRGDYSDRLKAAIERLPVSKQQIIEVVPETSDAALYYSAADVLAFTSRVESFPRVILEAMAARLPIITTPVYGVAEQVQENINALFYSPGDATALANHISRLLRDTDLRQKLAKNARCVLDTLTDFDEMVSSYAAVFREAWLNGGPV